MVLNELVVEGTMKLESYDMYQTKLYPDFHSIININ